jgi:predicted HTH transcriptional regulator
MPTKEGDETIGEALARMGTPLPFNKKRGRIRKEILAQMHSQASVEAAVSMLDKSKSLRANVLRLLRDKGPLTDEAIAVELKLNPSTARPRRIELVNDGVVVRVGEGKTTSGRRAALWGVSALGANE